MSCRAVPAFAAPRSSVPVPPLTKEAIKRLGLYNQYTDSGEASDKGAVLGRYIRARVSKTKMSTTLESTADFYIDFRKGVHRWEGLAERLMFEGRLRCATDGLSDYEMCVDGSPIAPGGVELVKFPTKKDWLNYLVQHQELLFTPQVEDIKVEGESEIEDPTETTREAAKARTAAKKAEKKVKKVKE